MTLPEHTATEEFKAFEFGVKAVVTTLHGWLAFRRG